ncbi:MAG: DUF1569 domain-containing protein [Flavobacteriales bacterium]|jgi:hypothetical protein|nr:DUF1569 domain-containing protein [Flavobacteriales bacterium]
MKNVFKKNDVALFFERIDKITPESQPKWGKMSADQMLAHCNVTYEYIFEDKYKKPRGFKRFLLKAFVKNAVVNEKKYPKNSRTAPDFIISDERNFQLEKDRLKNYMNRVLELGEDHFEGKESHSFGVLSKNEWNNMLAKHLEHHLEQFGV